MRLVIALLALIWAVPAMAASVRIDVTGAGTFVFGKFPRESEWTTFTPYEPTAGALPFTTGTLTISDDGNGGVATEKCSGLFSLACKDGGGYSAQGISVADLNFDTGITLVEFAPATISTSGARIESDNDPKYFLGIDTNCQLSDGTIGSCETSDFYGRLFHDLAFDSFALSYSAEGEDIVVTPLPASAWLILAGLGALFGIKRRP